MNYSRIMYYVTLLVAVVGSTMANASTWTYSLVDVVPFEKAALTGEFTYDDQSKSFTVFSFSNTNPWTAQGGFDNTDGEATGTIKRLAFGSTSSGEHWYGELWGDLTFSTEIGFTMDFITTGGQGLATTGVCVNKNCTTFDPTVSNQHIILEKYTPSAVPVPAAVWLFGSGLIGLVGMARRKKV